MLVTRLIPVLLLHNESLVKTTNFKNFKYIGDPCNTVRIFNELEVDELIILDILASKKNHSPNFNLLKMMAEESFMPLSYGGGISNLNDAKKIFELGFEKIVINSSVIRNPSFIKVLSKHFGSQSIVVSIDVKKNIFGRKYIYNHSNSSFLKVNMLDWIKNIVKYGAGEIFLTSVDQEGTWKGFDKELINEVVSSVPIPVIAHGGAGDIKDIVNLNKDTDISGIGLGNLVVYQKKNNGVLVNFPKLNLT